MSKHHRFNLGLPPRLLSPILAGMILLSAAAFAENVAFIASAAAQANDIRVGRRPLDRFQVNRLGGFEPRPFQRQKPDYLGHPERPSTVKTFKPYVDATVPQPRYSRPNYNVRPSFEFSTPHSDWCETRYRSYRASDNSFQPVNGDRRQCRSPFS